MIALWHLLLQRLFVGAEAVIPCTPMIFNVVVVVAAGAAAAAVTAVVYGSDATRVALFALLALLLPLISSYNVKLGARRISYCCCMCCC